MDESSAVAGDGGYATIGLACGRPIQEMAPMGLLVFPAQQRPLGSVGLARQGLRAHSASGRSSRSQHSGRGEERLNPNKKNAAIAGRAEAEESYVW
jgi:hypothetical protein